MAKGKRLGTRLLVSLIIMVLLAGAGFFLGWVEFRLPAGSVAVLFSKTGGWEDTPVTAGGVTWRWHFLIPTNASLYSFSTTPRTVNVRASGTLPSAALLETFIGEQGAFDYDALVTVSYRLEEATLPKLADELGLRPETMDGFYRDIETQVQAITAEAISELLETAEVNSDVSIGSFTDRLQAAVTEALPDVEFTQIVPTKVEVPNGRLYRATAEAYLSIIDSRRDAERASAIDSAQEREAEQLRIELLEQYGRVLAEYPVLLDYLRMAAERGSDPLALERLQSIQIGD